MNFLEHATTILRSFDIEPAPLDRCLKNYLTRHRDIGASMRRQLTDVVFGIMRHRGRIDGFLEMNGVKSTDRNRVIAYLVWQCDGSSIRYDYTEDARLAKIAGAPPAVISRGFLGGAAAFNSMPQFLFDRLSKKYGEAGASEIADALNTPISPVVRVNTMKIQREVALAELLRGGITASTTERSPYGIRLAQRSDLRELDLYKKGMIEVQDEGSQLAAMMARVMPGERVLDACAGGGGKSLQFAAQMRDKGRIIAADISASRLDELQKRADRAGYRSIEPLVCDLVNLPYDLVGSFDCVFVDAPCTGLGTLRRSPDLKWRLAEDQIAYYTDLQRRILLSASKAVRVGGRLIFATCSILDEESIEVTDQLTALGCFERRGAGEILLGMGIAADGIVDMHGDLFIDPRRGEWDGFSVAAFDRL